MKGRRVMKTTTIKTLIAGTVLMFGISGSAMAQYQMQYNSMDNSMEAVMPSIDEDSPSSTVPLDPISNPVATPVADPITAPVKNLEPELAPVNPVGSIDPVAADPILKYCALGDPAKRLELAKIELGEAQDAERAAYEALLNSGGLSVPVVKVDTVDLTNYTCAATAPSPLPINIATKFAEFDQQLATGYANAAYKIVSMPACQCGKGVEASIKADRLSYNCVPCDAVPRPDIKQLTLSKTQGTVIYSNTGQVMVMNNSEVGKDIAVTVAAKGGPVVLTGSIVQNDSSSISDDSAQTQTGSSDTCESVNASCFGALKRNLNSAPSLGIISDTGLDIYPSRVGLLNGQVKLSTSANTFPIDEDASNVTNVIEAQIAVSGTVKSLAPTGDPTASMTKGSVVFSGSIAAESVKLGSIESTSGECRQEGLGGVIVGNDSGGSPDGPPGMPAGQGFTIVYTNSTYGSTAASGGPSVLASNTTSSSSAPPVNNAPPPTHDGLENDGHP